MGDGRIGLALRYFGQIDQLARREIRQLPKKSHEPARLYLVLLDANPFAPEFSTFHVGEDEAPVPLAEIFDELVGLLAERNPDFYQATDGDVEKAD